MLKNVVDLTNEGPSKGLNTNHDILGIDKEESPNMMNVLVDFDGSSMRRLGSDTRNTLLIADSASAAWTVDVAGTLTQNLQAFWRLNESSGDRKDIFGGHTLIDNGGVGQAGGIRNQAALFVATNSQYLLHNNTSTLATGDIDFSVSSWIYLSSTSTTANRTIVSKRDSGNINLNTLLLMHLNSSNYDDSSVYNRVVTASGGADISTSISKFGGGSLVLNGSVAHLKVPSSNDFIFSTSDFTIDFQVRLDTYGGAVRHFFMMGTTPVGVALNIQGNNDLRLVINGTNNDLGAWSAGTATWAHVLISRSSTTAMVFVNGAQVGTSALAGNDIQTVNPFNVGITAAVDIDNATSGHIDELRVIKGEATNIANFTAPTRAYLENSEFEYNLYVGSDNIVTFEASSSGYDQNVRARATSFGALTTSTWYNVVAWHDTGNFLGLSVNLHVNSSAYASGIRSGSAPFVLGSISNGASGFFDGRIDETGFWKKVLTAQNRTDLYNSGNGNTYTPAFTSEPWASFDFGATTIRWLTVSAGTGVYASSNLGVTWVTIATDRTATYQYLDRSKNVLVATSDRYDTPLAWSGSANTFATILNPSAPLCKYSINFNGYLILLNSQARKRGFFYEDENTQLTGAWTSNFDIPSTQDDEITSAFILRRYLYISTRYYLYRVSFVGGNPDFSYLKVKDWGYVPRTVKFIYMEGVGQIVTGLCWDQKIRVFDGSDDKIISGNVEEDNGECEFGLSKIGRTGSDMIISFAETDYNENVYKLVVAIGQLSSQTTHMLNFDGRSQAFYPYSRQHYNTMTMAESGNLRYLMAFDRSGRCHMLNSGNLDGNTTPVDDFMDTALIFEKSPSQSHKAHETHLFFSNLTCGRIYYQDRIDFDVDWKTRKTFVISGSSRKLQHHEVIDIPEGYNVYQGRITSSSSTSDPWRLNRVDHFTQGLGIGRNV